MFTLLLFEIFFSSRNKHLLRKKISNNKIIMIIIIINLKEGKYLLRIQIIFK